MKVYIVAITSAHYMVPVSGVYKTYNGAKNKRDEYTKDMKKTKDIKILVADNWHEEDENE